MLPSCCQLALVVFAGCDGACGGAEGELPGGTASCVVPEAPVGRKPQPACSGRIHPSMALLASMEESGFRCLAVTGLGRAKDACSFQRPDVALIMCSSCAGCRRQGAQYRPWDAAAGLLERLGQLGTPVVVASDGPEAARLAGCGDVAAVLTGGYGPADLAGAARLVCTTTVPLTTVPLITDPLTAAPLTAAPLATDPLATDPLTAAPTGPRAMGSVLLDVARGVVSLGGRSVELTAKELAALTLLVAERGNLVTTEAVLAHVWPSPTTATKGDVYSLVYRVRRRVDDLDRRPPLIRSRRGLGYLLDPHVLGGLARDRGAGKGFGFLGAVL